jgi:hypothetical protein
MDPTYARIRERARHLASRMPLPVFYQDCSDAARKSRQFFESDAIITRLRAFVTQCLDNDFGHGLDHAEKVTLDAGALIIIEGKRFQYTDAMMEKRLRVVQSAGLLHDIRRKEKNHARKGAEFARECLKRYPFSPDEIADIHQSIGNHEAFTEPVALDTPEGNLVSDCLYDADKFRWGPDNFTHTVWDMVSYSSVPPATFIALYPKAMKGLTRIRTTFRTETGCIYGPDFIDLGLAIGNKLLKFIQTEFIDNPA